jgi:hypothetical protein
MVQAVKITSLNDIGTSIMFTTLVPVVNMTGTPTTEKANLQIVGNLILSEAGGSYFPPAARATVAQVVAYAAQPNITSVGTLNSLDVLGNINAGNANLGNLVIANVFSGFLNGSAVSANVANTVAVNAQPNITSLGTLTSLNVTGLANLGAVTNITITGGNPNYVLKTDGNGTLSWVAQTGGNGGGGASISNGTSNVNIPVANGNVNISSAGIANVVVITDTSIIAGAGGGGSITGANLVSANYFTGTLTTNDQPNITSLGTLTSLNVTGLANLGDVTDITITGGNPNYVLQTDGNGTLSWAAQTGGSADSISNGTSNVNIPVANGNVNISSAGIANVVVITDTSIIAGGGGGGNITGANLVSANYFTGTLTTNDQPNITSLGTLTSLNVTGLANLGDVTDITITGGNPNYVLQTDGNGTLSWAAQTGGGGNANTGNITFTNANISTDLLNTDIQIIGNGTGDVNVVANSKVWTFNADGNLTIPGNIIVDVVGDAIIESSSNVDVSAGGNTWTFGSDGNLTIPGNIIVDVVGDAIIESSSNVNVSAGGNTWTFGADGNLTLPNNTFAVNYANGTQVSIGGNVPIANDSTPGIMALGNGFVLNSNNQVSTSNLYNTNLTQPTQHYTLNLDTNGVVHLPDQSIINGSTLRGAPGTSALNYTGITIGPDSGNPENTWMWVDASNAYIATNYGANAHTWTFSSDGNLTIPGNIIVDVVGDAIIESSSNVDVSAGNNTWTFGANGNLTTPGNIIIDVVGDAIIESSSNVNVSAGGNTWTFGVNGNLTLPGNLVIAGNTSVFGTNAALIQSNPNVPLLSISSGNNGGVSSIWAEDIGNIGTSNIAAVYTNPIPESGIVRIAVGQNGNGGPNLWDFNQDGSAILPRGGIIYETNIPGGVLTGNTIVLKPQGGTNPDQQLLIYPTAIGSDFNHLHMTSSNLYNTELFLGNDDFYVKLANTGNVIINSNNGTGNSGQWNFDYTGNLTFPRIANSPQPILRMYGGLDPGIESIDANLAGPANLDITALNTIFTGYTSNSVTIYPDYGTISSSNNLSLTVPNGIPNFVTGIRSSSGSWESNPTANLATTGGSGIGLTVDVSQTGGYASTIVIHTPGIGYTNGDTITVTSGGSNAIFTISVYNNIWTFTTGGALAVAGNIISEPTIPAPSIYGFDSATFSSAVVSGNLFLNTGYIQGGIFNTVSDGINAIYGGTTTEMDVFGFPFSLPATRGRLVISGITTPAEANGTWYYQSVSTNRFALYTDDTYSTPVNSSSWSVYTGGGNVAIRKNNPAANIIIESNGYLTKFDNTGNLTLPSGGNLILPRGSNLIVSGSIVSGGASPAPTLSGFASVSALQFTNGNSNVTVNANSNLWTFDSTGNLTLPANAFAINYANGTQVSLGGGNVTWAQLDDKNGNSGPTTIALGQNAGFDGQGNAAIAIGKNAGQGGQGAASITIGEDAGGNTTQGANAVAIGKSAGFDAQGDDAIAIGTRAGLTNQGDYAVAIGNNAGVTNQGNNSIILNATGANLNQTTANTFTVAPVRNDTSNIAEVMFYNATSKEVTYGNTISVAGNITGAYVLGNGSQLTGISTSFAGEMHVSKNGNDSTGTGTILRPYLTITHALTQVAGGRNTIVIHPGEYTENPTITSTNTQLITYDATGASTIVIGTVTMANVDSRIAGLRMANLIIAGNSQAYISMSTVTGQFTKSSSGYVEVDDCELQVTGNVLISGSGSISIVGNKINNLVVNNAGAAVLVKGADDCVMPQVTAGSLNIVDSIIRASSNTANAVTASAGTVVTLMNNQIVTPAADNVARVSIAGYHSIISLVYDKANSTLSNSLNSVAYFQTANVDSLVSSGNITSNTANITTGNITTINSGLLQNGNSNITLAANGNVSIQAAGSTVELVVTSTGANITGTANITGNANVANIGATDGVFTGNISGNTNGFAIGYLNIPQVAASNTTIALSDAGKHYYSTSSGNFTLTIPNNATTTFATGTAISVVVQATGNVLVNAASGVTLYMAGNSTAANRVVSNYGMATLMKVNSDTWMISGTGVA